MMRMPKPRHTRQWGTSEYDYDDTTDREDVDDDEEEDELKHCQRHNGPRVLSLKLESSLQLK